jgi:hypothetical protein
LRHSLDELQTELDLWIDHYNNERPHSGKYCFGKTPMQTFKDSIHLAQEKILESHYQKNVSLPLSGKVETGSGGDQPVRNSLTDKNDNGALIAPLV